MGIKTFVHLFVVGCTYGSEKPPHHMGIKTLNVSIWSSLSLL